MANIDTDVEIIYDEEEKAIIIAVGSHKSILLKADEETANGNIYTEEVLKKAIKDIENNNIHINIDLNDKN